MTYLHRLQTARAWVTAPEWQRCQAFLSSLQARGRSAKTLAEYVGDFTCVARWSCHTNGELFDLTRLTAREVQEFKRCCQRHRRAPATINRRLSFVKQYVRYGFQQDVVQKTIYQDIQELPWVRTQPLAPRALDPQALRRYLKEVDLRASRRDQAIIATLLYTGLRVGELVHLRCDDVALSPLKGRLVIRAAHGKGDKERVVPVPRHARKALQAYLQERTNKDDTRDMLWVGKRGPLHTDAVARVVKKYAAVAAVAVSPHVLRHTFSYAYLTSNPNDLVGLADILGHANLQTTRRYTKKRLDDLQASIERVQFS